MIRYILCKDVQKLCDKPDLSDNGRYIRPIGKYETVFVNILDTYNDGAERFPLITIYLKCHYPDGHIEEGWTFKETIPPVKITNFAEFLDGRFNK